MHQLRLMARNRTVFIDDRPFVFMTSSGTAVLVGPTQLVLNRIERFVNRKHRGVAREYARAQLLQALRQYNSPKEGYTQFVVVDDEQAALLDDLQGHRRENALDQLVVAAIGAKTPVDLLAIEHYARERDLWIGLSGKNQLLGGKARLVSEGIVSDFEPTKLVARSLLDKPEAFTGQVMRLLVCDDTFVNGVIGDGAFLLRSDAPRAVSRTVDQRIRRSLDYSVNDAPRGEVYLEMEHGSKRARYDTEILDVREDGDILHIHKRESAMVDTGAKLVHALGFKGTAIVVDRLPDHIEAEWPGLHGVVNSSCIKSNALLARFGTACLTGDFQRGWILSLPVRLLFTGHERMKGHGNRVSRNVLSTLHGISPVVAEDMIESRVDQGPAAVVHGLLWWADHLQDEQRDPAASEALSRLPIGSKQQLEQAWGEEFERRLAFGDAADHPLFDTEGNPRGFWLRGRGGNYLLVPSARLLLATLGKVEVHGEPGFFYPEFLNTLLQVIRSLDVRPAKFEAAVDRLRASVLRAAHALVKNHSIRVPGLHGVLLLAKGLGPKVVVPARYGRFHGTIHGEPCMHQDGIRQADVLPLPLARTLGSDDPHVDYLLTHLDEHAFEAVLGDWDRLTRQNRDSDGDLIYVSRLRSGIDALATMDAVAESVPAFIVAKERFADIGESFDRLSDDHDPVALPPEVVHRAVLETAASAQDVGSITWWKYVTQDALVSTRNQDLLVVLARVAQQYIDGLKGAHATSAKLFVALMRVWSRMAAPCITVRDDVGEPIAVRLTPVLGRELARAGYVDGTDYHSEVEIPHPGLAGDAYRKVKLPLGRILEAILKGLEQRGLCTWEEAERLCAALESEYGVYDQETFRDRERIVAERRARYQAVQQLYAIRPFQTLADVEGMSIRPLWQRLAELSVSPVALPEVIDSMAKRAQGHTASREQRVRI